MLPPMLPVSVSAGYVTTRPGPPETGYPARGPRASGRQRKHDRPEKGDAEQSTFLLREEQRRQQEQQKRRREADEDPDQHLAIPGDLLNADNTVPVVPLIEDAPRQGLWVDVEV